MEPYDTLKTKLLLVVSIAVMFVSMTVSSLVQSSGGKVVVKKLSFETDEGWTMSADLFVPKTATKDNPAPAIVTSHGNYNNKEMQDANFVELARRGYVVLSVDQPNHGNSEDYRRVGKGVDNADNGVLFKAVYQGVLMLSRLPYVDKDKIGITGHSAGGRSCNLAIDLDNASDKPLIKSMLLNCCDAVYVQDGMYQDIYRGRDVGIISAVYDEFFHYQWDEPKGQKPLYFAPHFMESREAQSFLNFGKDPSECVRRQSDTIYRFNDRPLGAIRVIYRPNIIHPWSHFSKRATADVIDYFENSFGAPRKIGKNNQIWQWKEFANGLGIIGLVLFMMTFMVLMTRTQAFADVCVSNGKAFVAPLKVKDLGGLVWYWCCIGGAALFATLIYERSVGWGASLEKIVSQPESFGLAMWSFFCGIFTLLVTFLWYYEYGRHNDYNLVRTGVLIPRIILLKTVLLAIITACVSYAWVFFAEYFFKVDFRLWTLAFKTFRADKVFTAFAPYLWMFLVYYVAASVASNCFNYNTIGGKFNAIMTAAFSAFPAIILPLMQYVHYLATSRMLFWSQTVRYHMYTLWLFPIIAILLGNTLVTRYVYRRTKNAYLPGIVNGIIVTLITVANTRMYFH